MPTLEQIRIASIDRITDHIRTELQRVLAHRKLLEQENPAALPLQDAIIEKELFDNRLPSALAQVQQMLQQQDLSPELTRALIGLEQACNEAQAAAPWMNWEAPIQ